MFPPKIEKWGSKFYNYLNCDSVKRKKQFLDFLANFQSQIPDTIFISEKNLGTAVCMYKIFRMAQMINFLKFFRPTLLRQ